MDKDKDNLDWNDYSNVKPDSPESVKHIPEHSLYSSENIDHTAPNPLFKETDELVSAFIYVIVLLLFGLLILTFTDFIGLTDFIKSDFFGLGL